MNAEGEMKARRKSINKSQNKKLPNQRCTLKITVRYNFLFIILIKI